MVLRPSQETHTPPNQDSEILTPVEAELEALRSEVEALRAHNAFLENENEEKDSIIAIQEVALGNREMNEDEELRHGLTVARAVLRYKAEKKVSDDEKEKLRQEAIEDPLTGVLNRRGFFYAVEVIDLETRHDRRNQDLSLLHIDIDKLKDVNDSEGHAAGDNLIVQVANTLKERLRDDDVIARFGGDEFIVLLQNVSQDDAMYIAEQLRKQVEAIIPPEGYSYNASLSIGVGKVNNSIDEVISATDDALFEAKRNGRNQVVAVETKS